MKRLPSNASSIKTAVLEYKHSYASSDLINSFIMCFMESNNIPLEFIDSSHECKLYFYNNNSSLHSHIKKRFIINSISDLESIFEHLIDIDRKKSEGVVYTPNYIIDYIINYCINLYKGNKLPVLCDPSCGSGGFLVRAIDIMANKFNFDSMENVVNNIYGIDINSHAVSYARILIELYFMSRGISPPFLGNNIICADTLMAPKASFISRFELSKDGFDLIVTNPPYVKLQNIESNYRDKLLSEYSSYTKGSFSLALLFLIAGHNLLSKNGILGFITQNNLFSSLSGVNVRKYLTDNKLIHTIIDFGHNKIFNNASAYTCLLFLDNEDKNNLLYNSCGNPNKKLGKLTDSHFSHIPISSLNHKKWRLADQEHLNILTKLESNGMPLGHIADIRVGFATLKDSVFLLANNSNIDIENEITRPAIKVADLTGQDSLRRNIRKIIFPYKKVGNRWLPIEIDEFAKKFPKALKYLENKKELLLKRDKGKGKYKYFYEWGRTQGMDAPGPKLLTKTFNKGPNFLTDNSDALFCNGYSVKPKQQIELFQQYVKIDILQKILNSIVLEYYTKLTSFQLNGNYQCFQKNFLEKFCIPNLTETEIAEIDRTTPEHMDMLICRIYGLNYNMLAKITME